jgi:two-component system, cell cycle response regulator CtrA
MRVLIIEDNHSTAQTVELALAKEGIICDRSDLGEDGIEVSKIYDYDLIILDIMLPDVNGYEVLKRMRKVKADVPILILSGLGDYEQKIKGLGFGADDYLTKPFHVGELIARVKTIIRRSRGHPNSIITIVDLQINLDTHTATVKNKALHLTTKEQLILELMALKKGQVITKEQFLTHLYNGIDEPEAKIIDVFVCKMRKKLCNASNGVNYVETIWGRGYALKHPNELPENQKQLTTDE